MKKTHAIVEKNKSIITCIGIGLLVTVLISLVMTMALTGMIQKGKLLEKGSVGVFITRAIATMAGSLLGATMSSKKILPVIGAITAGYFCVLLVIGLLMLDGSLNSVWQGMISVVIGGVIACLIKLKPQRTKRKRVRLVG